jgi:hypothetical protein
MVLEAEGTAALGPVLSGLGGVGKTQLAVGALASQPFTKARAATIRRDLIAVAARTARHGRGQITLHLPEGWHREREWLGLLAAACGPSAAAA